MAEARIPVDVFNPGQVFACLGFLEAAEILQGEAMGAFDWIGQTQTSFVLRSAGQECPIRTTIEFLRNAEVITFAPDGSHLTTEAWQVQTTQLKPEQHFFPFPLPTSPATLPALLRLNGTEIPIQHWGEDTSKTGIDNVKFWAGAGGYPGAALARDALSLIKNESLEVIATDPFNFSARQSSSFRFDWRRDYVPIEIGFSLNAHSSDRFSTVGYPLVEILAAIGLTNARPKRISKLEYIYGIISDEADIGGYDLIFLRSALGAGRMPFPQRYFRMNLDWPGQEGQARCITIVEEITTWA